MESQLGGKHVLITGASGGIGQATAWAFAGCGANLLLHYHRNAGPVETLCGTVGVSVHTLQADLRNEAQAVALFARAEHLAGHIDAVVVNAGIWNPTATPLAEMSVRQWQDTLDTDLLSAFLTCREYLRHLTRRPREAASVVLVGSTAALFGEEGHADYAAAKAALTYGLMRSLKNEIVRVAPRGRVNCVCPGWTLTPMSAGELGAPGVLERATCTMPLRKVAQPEDIAGAIVMLSSDRLAGHISGAILPIAGGMEGRRLH